MRQFYKPLFFAFACITLGLSGQTFAEDSKPTNKMSVNVDPKERAKIEAVVHDYLLEKPEVVVEALQSMQRKQYEDAQKTIENTKQNAAKYAKELFQQKNDPVYGNPDGSITVVEFFDYQCPHCVVMAPVMEAVTKADKNVRVIYKDFPIRGPASNYAARAALAANMQGKYYEVHHAILTANPPLTKEGINELVKNAGLDMEKFNKDIDSKQVENQITANMKLARELKLFGTPAFFIGKTNATGDIEYVPGQINETELEKIIQKLSS